MVIRGWWSWAGATITMGVVLGMVRNGGMTFAHPLQHQEDGRTALEQESVENFPMILRYDLPKRNAFRSWGGKRSVFGSTDGLPIALRRTYLSLFQTARPKVSASDVELKRASFSPWGGKRPDPSFAGSNSPRISFRPWGGKRSQNIPMDIDEMDTDDLIPYLQLLQNSEIPSSHHEANQGYDSYWDDRQTKIADPSEYYITDYNMPVSSHNPFRYKRQAQLPVNQESLQTEPFETQVPDTESQELRLNRDKRTKFSAWAGKRLDINAIREQVRRWVAKSPKVPERRAFSAWAGKRSVPNEFPGLEQKRAFSAWAGKRSVDAYPENEDDKRAFSAWSGKRSDDLNSFEESSNISYENGNNKTAASSNDDNNWNINDGITLQPVIKNNKSNKEVFEKRDADLNKRQSFSAWAGKRNEDPEKQQSFSAWAGKRDNDPNKRQSFSAWAGKRNDDPDKRQAFNAWAGKRQSFSAWAGKRNDDFDFDKRQSFSAWAGKRDGDAEKRQSFNAWAGKRSDDLDKRQSFSAWAGKRDNDPEKRQSFSAWAGKRDDTPEKRQKFNAWAGKRSDDFDKRQSFSAWAGKRKFSAWAGKRTDDFDKHQFFQARSGDLVNEQVFNEDENTKGQDDKRQSFSAWAGKRSEDYPNDDARQKTLTALQQLDRQIYGVPMGKELLPLHNWSAADPFSFDTWEGNKAALTSKDHNLKDLVLSQL